MTMEMGVSIRLTLGRTSCLSKTPSSIQGSLSFSKRAKNFSEVENATYFFPTCSFTTAITARNVKNLNTHGRGRMCAQEVLSPAMTQLGEIMALGNDSWRNTTSPSNTKSATPDG